jgi:hypothetical protein
MGRIGLALQAFTFILLFWDNEVLPSRDIVNWGGIGNTVCDRVAQRVNFLSRFILNERLCTFCAKRFAWMLLFLNVLGILLQILPSP